jgi:monoterpene epsilon-lactone hydrolase
MQTTRQTELKNFSVTRHPLAEGERARQEKIFRRNADLAGRFGTNIREFYAAMVSQTEIAAGVVCAEVSEPEAKGWWVRPRDSGGARAILYIHGGGYRLGDAASYRGLASQIAARARCPVFVMDYPLAPEHRFPAAFDAAVKACNWLAANGIDQFAIIGDSAGGGLALSVLNEPMPKSRLASVVVFSPWIDLALEGQSFNDPTMRDPVFQPAILADAATLYLAGADPKDPRASALYGIPDDLPPIAIQVGSEELLLDDSRRYAELAASRGGEVALDIFEGMHHVFQSNAGSIETADRAIDSVAQFVTAHWD